MSLFGIVDEKNKTMKYEITVPSLLSFLVYMDFKTPVAGLDQFPQEDWPPVAPVYYSYRVMLQMFAFMLLAVTAGIWLWRKGQQWDNPWILRYLAIAFVFPQLANQAGWFSCEVGRQPWVVQGLLRRGDAFSKTVPASEMIIGITMFSAIYIVLFVLFAYLLWEKIQHGPENKHSNEKTTEPQPEAL
jgi:cytochrome d ubiquinol oxidase subunit I